MLCSSVRFDSEKGNVSFVESNAICLRFFTASRSFHVLCSLALRQKILLKLTPFGIFYTAGGFRLGSSRVLCSSVQFDSEKRM